MKKSLALLAVVIAISGCSLFGGVTEKIADTIDDYCTKEPYSQREVYRESINKELAAKGHAIAVSCNGDPAPE